MPLRNAEEEVALVKMVLADPYVFDLDFGGGLILIRPTDRGTIEVEWGLPEGKSTASFPADSMDEAARFFVDKRSELRAVIDYESEDMKAKKVFTLGTKHGRKILYEPAPGSIPERERSLLGVPSNVDADAFVHWLEHGGEPPKGV